MAPSCYPAEVTQEGPEAVAPAPGAGADGLLDLLGLLAYASLTAFFRISEDAALELSLASWLWPSSAISSC